MAKPVTTISSRKYDKAMAALRAAPTKFTPKGIAPPGVSKQRPFAFGGRTPGPELYDDGLTVLERNYIDKGSK